MGVLQSTNSKSFGKGAAPNNKLGINTACWKVKCWAGWIIGRLTFASAGRYHVKGGKTRLLPIRFSKRNGAGPAPDGTALFTVLTVPSAAGIQRSKVPVMGKELERLLKHLSAALPAPRSHLFSCLAGFANICIRSSKQNYTCKIRDSKQYAG